MDAADWQKVEALFEATVDLEEEGRETLLAEQADPQIVAEVRALLAADDADAGPLDQALIPAPRGLEAGTMVGEYEVVSRLGAGAFGVVYLARHPMLDKRAAVKVLDRRFASDATAVDRFLTEARAASGIGHPGIADVFGFGAFDDGSHYYVMAYVDGPSLDAYVRENAPVDLEVALQILAPLADALDAAHRRGIVHRDLKPANVMLQRSDDGRLAPKLVDFGIAKLIDEHEGAPKLTQTGMTLGTPAYMAPEQAKAGDVGAAADRYALGVITFELLTGRRPFVAETTIETMMKHVSEPPPKPTSLRPELGALVDDAVVAMLAKDPAERPPTAAAAIRALHEASTPQTPRADSPNAAVTSVPETSRSVSPNPVTSSPETPASAHPNPETPLAGQPTRVKTAPSTTKRTLPAALVVGMGLAAAIGFVATNDDAPAPVVEIAAPVPTAPPPAATPEPIRTDVRVVGEPKGARIYSDEGQLLGALPATITLDDPKATHVFEVKMRGYESTRLEFVPAERPRLRVRLEKKLHQDLESPF